MTRISSPGLTKVLLLHILNETYNKPLLSCLFLFFYVLIVLCILCPFHLVPYQQFLSCPLLLYIFPLISNLLSLVTPESPGFTVPLLGDSENASNEQLMS